MSLYTYGLDIRLSFGMCGLGSLIQIVLFYILCHLVFTQQFGHRFREILVDIRWVGGNNGKGEESPAFL